MNGMFTIDQLWRMIRSEAESAVARDPIFGAALSSAILDHPDFAYALAHQIGERLGKTPADRQRFARIAGEAFAASPDLVDAGSLDLQSIAVHDPATTALLPPLLNFKGYVALQAWRVSNWLWREERRDLALLPAKPVVRSASGLHSSMAIDRHVGTSRTRHRHHRRRPRHDRRRGDDPAKRDNRPKQSEPDRAPKIGKGVYFQRRIDHYRQCQRRRFRQDRRRRGRRA